MNYQERINNIINMMEPIAKMHVKNRTPEQKEQLAGLRARLLKMPKEFNSLIRSELARLMI